MLPRSVPRLAVFCAVFFAGGLLCMGLGSMSGAARGYREVVATGSARLEAAPSSAALICQLPADLSDASVDAIRVEPPSAIAPAPVVVGRRLLASVAPGEGALYLTLDGVEATAHWAEASPGSFVRCAPGRDR